MTRSPIHAVLACGLLALAPALAGQQVFTIDPAKTAVTFDVEATGHDVHGTLVPPSGTIEFDAATGAASGQIRIELRGAVTGNGSRDKTLHKDVFETEKFPTVTFTAQRLTGAVPASGSAEITLSGLLAIHGGEHPIAIPAKVTASGERIAVEGSFDVPFVEWGMHDPSWFVLKVAKTVKVNVKAEGSLGSAVPAGR